MTLFTASLGLVDSSPTRTLPNKPSLAQLRKQAKELLKSYQAGDQPAIDEVARFERSPDPTSFALADAQRVLARAYGFPSWTKLKQQVDGLNVEAFCEAAAAGDVATVRKLARARPELVHLDRGGPFGERIALHFAVLNRDTEMTRVLMELGSDAHKGVWPHRDATTAYPNAHTFPDFGRHLSPAHFTGAQVGGLNAKNARDH